MERAYPWLCSLATGFCCAQEAIREACFRDPGDLPPIRLDGLTRALCVLLIIGILALGVAPGRFLDTVSSSLARADLTLPTPPVTSAMESPEAASSAAVKPPGE